MCIINIRFIHKISSPACLTLEWSAVVCVCSSNSVVVAYEGVSAPSKLYVCLKLS